MTGSEKRFFNLYGIIAFITILASFIIIGNPDADAALQLSFTQQSTDLGNGQEGTWTLTVTNPDSAAVSDASVKIEIPTDFKVTSAGGGTESAGPPHTLTWSSLSIPGSGNSAFTFKAFPICDAGTGKQLIATAQPGGISIASDPIVVQRSLVEITLADSSSNTVSPGHVGDNITSILTIHSSYAAVSRGADVTFTLGSGMTFVSIASSSGHSLPSSLSAGTPKTWNTGNIPKDGNAVYQIVSTVSDCEPENLINEVSVNWGDSLSACLPAPRTASHSVALQIREPVIAITHTNPSPVAYCSGSAGGITISNSGVGPAKNFRLKVGNFPDTWEITDITPSTAVFNDATDTFTIPDIPPSGNQAIQFKVKVKSGNCTIAKNANVFFDPIYVNECGKELGTEYVTPISGPHAWTVSDAGGVPTFTVNKTGPEVALLGETLTYSVEATYTGPANVLPYTVNIIDTYPTEFFVVDNGGGTDAGGKITWSDVTFTAPGQKVSKSIKLRVPTVTENPCAAFQTYRNSATVSSVPNDCHNCPGIIVGGGLDTFITDVNGPAVSNSQASQVIAGKTDVCSTSQFRACYTFKTSGPTSWAGISFTGSITGPGTLAFMKTDSITVNGTEYSGSCGTFNSLPADLSCLTAAGAPAPNAGVTLCLTYTYETTNIAYGGYEHVASLIVPTGMGTGCGGSLQYDVKTPFSVEGSTMSLALESPVLTDACKEDTYSLNISGTRIAYDTAITLNTQNNYEFAGTLSSLSFENIKDSNGAAIAAFEPTNNGNGTYTWNFGDILPAGTIRVKMRPGCSTDRVWKASAVYNNVCENGTPPQRSASAESSPVLVRSGIPTLHMVPAKTYAATPYPFQTLYIVNGGAGALYNTDVTVTFDTDLEYKSYSTYIGPGPDNVNVVNPHSVIFHFNEIAPGAQKALTLTGKLVGCNALTIRADLKWGCLGVSCNTRSETALVVLSDAEMTLVDHYSGILDYCGDSVNFSIMARNTGKTDVFNAMLRELLPPGVAFIEGSSTASNPGGYGSGLTGSPVITTEMIGNRQQITWDFRDVLPVNPDGDKAVKKGSELRVGFIAHVSDCVQFFDSDKQAQAWASFSRPCNFLEANASSASAPLIKITVPAKPHVTVVKKARNFTQGTSLVTDDVGADVNDETEWEITYTSDGDYTAKNIYIRDVLPGNAAAATNFSSTCGSCTATDYFGATGCSIGNLAVGGQPCVVTFRTKVTSCQDPPTVNQAFAKYGCCTGGKDDETSSGSVSLHTSPDFASARAFLAHRNWTTCDGEISLAITNTGGTARTENIVYTMPAGYTFDESASCSITKTGTPPNVTHAAFNCTGVSGNTPTWNASNIDFVAPGETVTITFRSKMDGKTYCDTTGANDPTDTDINVPDLNGAAVFTYKNSCGVTGSASDSEPILPAQPDLDIAIDPVQQVAASGDKASWTITLTNEGDAPASNIVLTYKLGNGFSAPSVTSGPAGTWDAVSHTYTWNIAGPVAASG
ncbi:MAG: hypothetical protein BWK80_53545, partial [Desulfobacteraceae bacterium IS3]